MYYKDKTEAATPDWPANGEVHFKNATMAMADNADVTLKDVNVIIGSRKKVRRCR